jgi:hypothetical protein
MFRKLLVYRIDIRGAARLRHPHAPTGSSSAPGIEFRWLAGEALAREDCIVPRAAALRRERVSRGGRCLIGTDALTGAIAYTLWLTTGSAWIEWIFHTLSAPADSTLAFDVWVRPDRRGRAIHRTGAALAALETLDLGRQAGWAGVEEHEFFPFAAMYARAGIGIAEPQYFLVGLKLGPLRLHWRRPPPRRVLEFSARLRREVARGSDAVGGTGLPL